jgi:lambda family phage portal protein
VKAAALLARSMHSLATWAGGVRDAAVRHANGVRPRNVHGMEAGRTTRADPDFLPSAAGVNLTNERYLDLAVRRVRALVLDNPHFDWAVEVLLSNTIGVDGVGVHANTGDDALNAAIDELWWQAERGVDVTRQADRAESQAAWLREVWSAGECLAYFPILDSHRGFERGPSIELIDRDRILMSLNGVDRGRRLRQGVVFDAEGRPLEYLVLRDNPEDGWWFSGSFAGAGADSREIMRISSLDSRLGFVQRRLGQIRGIPWPVAAVSAARMEEAFTEAELLLARARAAIGLFVEGGSRPTTKGRDNEGAIVDQYGRPMMELVPGMIGHLPTGAKMHTLSVTTPGATFNATDELLLRRMAAGLKVGYATLTRDRSQSTYSSDRADLIEDRKTWRRVGRMVYRLHTRGYYERCIDWWRLTGKLRLSAQQEARIAARPGSLYEVFLSMPGQPYVNPKQEAEGDEIALRAGVRTLRDVCGDQGVHWQDQIDQRLREEQYEKDQRQAMGLPDKSPVPVAANGEGGAGGDERDGRGEGEDDERDDERAER